MPENDNPLYNELHSLMVAAVQDGDSNPNVGSASTEELMEIVLDTLWPGIVTLLADIKLYEELRQSIEKYISANAINADKVNAWAEVGTILHYLHYKLDKTQAEFERMYPGGERRPTIYPTSRRRRNE